MYTASDQRHDVGTCNPADGVCSQPAKANGTACSDGNACTQTDTCQSGSCAGGNPVVCTPASDQCHDAGTCNTNTGVCSAETMKPDATPCVDTDLCTMSDTCQSGTCVSGGPVVCSALDPCHTAGTCTPATGHCSNPVSPDGTACNDGNSNTTYDVCTGGVCGGTPTYPVTFSYAIDSPDTRGVTVTPSVVCSTTCPAFDYDWDWGDNTTHGSLQVDSHTYATPGAKVIMLTVSLQGVSEVVGTARQSLMLPNPDMPPTVGGTCTWNADTWTLTVLDTSTDDGPDADTAPGDGNASLQIVVDWGELGTRSFGKQGASLSHTYRSADTFLVTQRAIDSKLQEARGRAIP